MDYQALLKKMIAYFMECEGTDYIYPLDQRYTSDTKFTDEEWSELERIHYELWPNDRQHIDA